MNFFDLCAVSLPMPGNGLATGLMIAARNGQDEKLFSIAAAVEKQFAGLGAGRDLPATRNIESRTVN
jgi:Asp-tRNA(Asn)/Glu-tRNA(Gln) amidotransferase A subunit family amidase